MDHIRVCGVPALIRVGREMFGSRTWMWMCAGERHVERQFSTVLLRETCVKESNITIDVVELFYGVRSGAPFIPRYIPRC